MCVAERDAVNGHNEMVRGFLWTVGAVLALTSMACLLALLAGVVAVVAAAQ